MTGERIDPTEAKWRKFLRRGAVTVRGAAEFTGISRSELFLLMRDGVLPWFIRGKCRMIPRQSLIEHLAALASDHETGAGARTRAG